MKQISGNKLLVKALKEEGVEYVFGYPGACTIDISDELYKQDDVTVILPRHEQALVHAADAYARTTGNISRTRNQYRKERGRHNRKSKRTMLFNRNMQHYAES